MSAAKLKVWDVVVIGAGLAGLSTAYHLAKTRHFKRILILEREKSIGLHASGNNAAMIRQAVEDPYLVDLAVQGRKLLVLHEKKSDIRSSFLSKGSMLLGNKEDESRLKNIQYLLDRKNIKSEFLSRKEASKKVDILKDSQFNFSLYCPSDGMVDLNVLLSSFLKAAHKLRLEICFGESIKGIEALRNSFLVRLKKRNLEAEKIVNAAGAWAGFLGQEAGATSIPFKAYRRHLFISKASTEYSNQWPFIWHIGNEFYFRPWPKNRLLLSPCDKDLFIPDSRAPKTDLEALEAEKKADLSQKLEKFSKRFKTIKIEETRSALRTMVPDGRFVVGEDPGLQNFYWVAGLGGHGVTTCFSVGALAADCVAGKKVESNLAQALSPLRFSR